MQIGLDTAVYCANAYCGVTYHLIIQPARQRLTHLVIKPTQLPPIADRVERLVSIAHIIEISDHSIYLKCTPQEFRKLPAFSKTNFMERPLPDHSFLDNEFWHPLASGQARVYIPVIKYNTPPGELVVNRQVQIEAQNGHLGQFEAFVIHPQTGEITHLVFQRGHIWNRKTETVAASVIDYLEGDTIYLNINKSDLTLE